MPTFTVGLARTCLVKVEAKNIQDVLRAAESFVDFKDRSVDVERKELDFRIIEIETVDNDAFEVA